MTYKRYYEYPPRTLCDILAEMRKAYESRNFAGLLGLVEEAQTKANRMEAALEGRDAIREIEEKRQEAKDELRRLEKELKQLENKVDNAKQTQEEN